MSKEELKTFLDSFASDTLRIKGRPVTGYFITEDQMKQLRFLSLGEEPAVASADDVLRTYFVVTTRMGNILHIFSCLTNDPRGCSARKCIADAREKANTLSEENKQTYNVHAMNMMASKAPQVGKQVANGYLILTVKPIT